MFRIKPLEEALREDQSIELGWKSEFVQLPSGILIPRISSPRFGEVYMAAVYKPDGTFGYDQPKLVLGPVDASGKRPLYFGSVIVPWFKNAKVHVGLVYREREGPINPRTMKHGVAWYELPQGFIVSGETVEQAAQRELREETGRLIKSLHTLWDFNHLPAFLDNYPIAYALEIDPAITEILDPRATEPILRCQFFDYDRIMNEMVGTEIKDSATHSGLIYFTKYLRQRFS